jgi:formamidopyrimidine-DNA glycosylase
MQISEVFYMLSDADITPSQSASQVSTQASTARAESVSQASTARELSIAGKRKNKPITDFWHHFSKLKGEKIQCDHCQYTLKKQKHSGTNIYWDHLKRCVLYV